MKVRALRGLLCVGGFLYFVFLAFLLTGVGAFCGVLCRNILGSEEFAKEIVEWSLVIPWCSLACFLFFWMLGFLTSSESRKETKTLFCSDEDISLYLKKGMMSLLMKRIKDGVFGMVLCLVCGMLIIVAAAAVSYCVFHIRVCFI